MRTFLKTIVVVFCITSCNDKKKKIDTELPIFILGEWSSLDKNSYTEYFFNERNMSTIGLSGNIYNYDYNLVNGKKLELVDRSGNIVSRYFEEIIKADSFEIVFKNITLYRLKKKHTLGVYLDKKTEYDSLWFHFLQRNNSAIPIDSVLKMAGEPIDIDELFEEIQ